MPNKLYTGVKLTSENNFHMVKFRNYSEFVRAKKWLYKCSGTYATSETLGYDDRYIIAFAEPEDLMMFILFSKEHERIKMWDSNIEFTLHVREN